MLSSITIADNPVTTTPPSRFGSYNFHKAGGFAHFDPRTYKRTLGDIGGYVDCDFHLVGEERFLNNMLAESLARECKTSNHLGVQDFLGVVWSMKFVTRKYWIRLSLENIYNRVLIIFTLQDDNENADRTSSTINIDTRSQERYGILTWQSEADGPVHSPAEIDLPAETSKDELSRPGRQMTVGDEGDPRLGLGQARLEVSCRGYHEYLKLRHYIKTDVDEDAQDDIGDVIQAVSDSVGQFVKTTDIAANTSQIDQYYVGSMTAWEILTQDIVVSNATPSRFVIGMWGDRELRYEQRVDMNDPENIAYFKLQDGRYRERDGRIISPIEMLPNRLIEYNSIVPRRPGFINTNRRDDLQTAYIRTIKYDGSGDKATILSAPYSEAQRRWQRAILGEKQYERKAFTQ